MQTPISTFKIPLRSSLIARSLVSIFFLLVLISGIAGYIGIRELTQNSKEDMIKESSYIGHITAESLGLPMWNLDEGQVRQQLRSLKNTNSCGAKVMDAQGKLFVNSNFPKVLGEDEFTHKEDIVFTNPIKDSNTSEVIGKIEICFSEAALNKRVHMAIKQQLMFTVMIMAVALAACYISLLILARPLLGFREAMKRVSTTMTPITDKALNKQNEIGALTNSFNMMVLDLTLTYQQLHAAKEAAEKADIAKSDFLANMTHELRTPLNSIIGMTSLLLERNHAAEDRKMMEVVNQSSKLLLNVVNDILDLSKIEAGEIKLENIGFDLDAIIERSIATVRHVAEQKSLKLKYAPHKKLPYLMGDPLRITQVMNNLLSNAIKYTDKGIVSVEVSFDKMGNDSIQLHCEVIDTGIGIPPEKLDKMFQKFMQVDASNSRRYGGTGLGLAITRQLIEMMEGKIGVRSNQSEGSTFWFTIPFKITDTLQDDSRSIIRKKRAELSGSILPENAKILVAEDHPLSQAFIKLLLAKYKFIDIDLFENGRDVLNAVANKNYDVVLMDCFMPEMSGFDATRAIRSNEQGRKRLPIVAMTANAMLGDEQKCLAAGMDDYIAKPVVENEFIAVLSQWIKFPEHLTAGLKYAEPTEAMDDVVNLSILKTFSEGDEAVEKQLLELFLAQSDANLTRLADAISDDKEWVEAAHSLKGGAGSVGAEILRKLCEQAQNMPDAPAAERQIKLEEISEAYQEVKRQIPI